MNRRTTIFAGLASAVALIVLALGLAILGMPSGERARGLDNQRISDLRDISVAIEAYYKAVRSLPPDLEVLRTRLPNRSVAQDNAALGQAYEYRPTSERTYELCARFDAPSVPDSRRPTVWNHGAGRHCFAFGVPGPS